MNNVTKRFFSAEYNLLPIFFTFLLIGLLFIFSFHRGELNSEILDTHVRILGLVSTKYQRLTYLLILAVFALLYALILLIRKPIGLIANDSREGLYLSVVVLFAFIFGSWVKPQAWGFGLTIFLFMAYRWNNKFRNVLERFFTLLRNNREFLRLLGWIVIILFLLFFWIVPFFLPLFLHSEKELRWVDGHYAVTILSGVDFLLRDDSHLKGASYGIGMPLLVAAFYKVATHLGVVLTELPHVVKFYQFVCLILIGIIIFVVNKRNFILGFLLAIIFTLYTLSNVGIALRYPNQSGLRYIPILLGLLFFGLELKLQRPRVWVLAIVSAMVVIFSPETGFAFTAGLIAATVLIGYKKITPFSSISLTLIKFITVFVLAFFFFYSLIVRPLLGSSGKSIFEFIGLFGGSGYGGLVERLSFSASLFFLIATTIILKVVVKAKYKESLSKDIWQIAIASMILVWLFYYINRMAEWNLWFQWVLFVFLLIPYQGPNQIKIESKQLNQPSVIFKLIILGLIVAQSSFSINIAYAQTRLWLSNSKVACSNSDRLNGFCLHGLGNSAISRQLAALNEFSPADTLVLTGLSTTVRVMGFNEKFPLFDPMEIVLKRDVHKIVEWIDTEGPRFIVADGPDSLVTLASPEHTEQIWLYLSSLKKYHEIERRSDWVIFERMKDSND